MAKIIGPGSCNVDLTGFAPRLPLAGETTIGDLVRTSPGGKGSNQMVAAHMSGSEAYLIAKIGDDVFANCLHDFYRSKKFPEKYTCWWGIDILPRINPQILRLCVLSTINASLIDNFPLKESSASS